MKNRIIILLLAVIICFTISFAIGYVRASRDSWRPPTTEQTEMNGTNGSCGVDFASLFSVCSVHFRLFRILSSLSHLTNLIPLAFRRSGLFWLIDDARRLQANGIKLSVDEREALECGGFDAAFPAFG